VSSDEYTQTEEDSMLGDKCSNMKIAGMSAETLVVHYGGAPWDESLSNAENYTAIERWVEEQGNWECVLGNAIESWARVCIEHGAIHTSSL